MKKSEANTYKTYGWFSNIIYNMKSTRAWDKKLFYSQLLPVIPNVAGTYLGALLPAEMLRGLENRWDIKELILYIFLLALGICLAQILVEMSGNYIWGNGDKLTLYYEKICSHKIMRLDYDRLEDPECGKLIGNTWNVMRNTYGFRDSLQAIPVGLGNLLGVIWYGLVIGQKSFLIVVLAMVNAVISMKLLSIARKKHSGLHEKIGVYTKESSYISKQSMDRAVGKDIRIYQMADWFLEKYDQSLKGSEGILRKIRNGYFISVSIDAVMVFILNCFSYIYLISLLLKGELAVSAFVLYIGLIRNFSSYFNSLMEKIADLDPLVVSMNYVRNFLDLEESPGWSEAGIGEEALSRIKEEGIRIEFKNVSYYYPGKEEAALLDVNLVIKPGERLALIGLNGAGKTTFAKLLCGFYRPNKGEILINGIPIPDFKRTEYFELISALFQDTTLLPLTLDYNLTCEEPDQIDRKRLEAVLKLSGVYEKYESLPKKGETLLVREVNERATDFSGGERQKMLFARALYKQARLMILDEPTAALDPIAENEMYMSFAKAAVGKTCLYISHRLSSTRFCDRIILMEHGRITEEGTHEELMAMNSRYAELYEMQSKYYKEQDERRMRSTAMEDVFEEQGESKEAFYE